MSEINIVTLPIMPLPVKKNKFGKSVKDIPVTTYYRQIAEEVLEAHNAAKNAELVKRMTDEGFGQCAEFAEINEPEELVDIITCCVTRLEIIGYDESARQKLYSAVNDKNRKRGYFEE